eukprot:11100892-Ditylum_brightwellii.AAC.1
MFISCWELFSFWFCLSTYFLDFTTTSCLNQNRTIALQTIDTIRLGTFMGCFPACLMRAYLLLCLRKY